VCSAPAPHFLAAAIELKSATQRPQSRGLFVVAERGRRPHWHVQLSMIFPIPAGNTAAAVTLLNRLPAASIATEIGKQHFKRSCGWGQQPQGEWPCNAEVAFAADEHTHARISRRHLRNEPPSR